MKAPPKKDLSSTAPRAPFAYAGLDRLIHEHARLSVLTALMTNASGLSFNELRQMCTLTDGNLSRHMQVLEEAGLISVFKGVERNRSLTLGRITDAGRKRYIEYLAVLEQVVTDAANAVEVGSQRKVAQRALRS